MQTLILGGGCFWGMQELFRQQQGVLETEVGYCGDVSETATYDHIKTGRTQHAEAIKVLFDPAETTLDALLDFFFIMHDPTTPNQQGNDKGRQYRSVIFGDDTVYAAAKEAINRNQQHWQKPIVTELTTPMPFYPAEPEHQDYLQRNPFGYTCHWVRESAL